MQKIHYASSTYGLSLLLSLVVVASWSLLAFAVHSSFYHQLDPKGCLMTYMYPTYYRILGFDREKTPLAGKYGLMLYRHDLEDNPPSFPIADASQLTRIGHHDWAIAKSARITLRGSPVLFIPGNAGSAKQVRSIATQSWSSFHRLNADLGERPFGANSLDFFTVDLNEEFSAFHGQLLLDQARYVNDAIAYILSLYAEDQPGISRPASVLIIGHSMGGIVARTLFTMDNYVHGSVNSILTLATPHMVPPLALDYDITDVYDRIETFWRQGYDGPHAALANVSLISVLGGYQDITVNSDSGNIHHIVPQSHGFSVFTTAIPHAWVGCDHLSILWCRQVTAAISQGLVNAIDARRPEQVKPLQERMSVFRNHLMSGSETPFSPIPIIEGLSLSSINHSFEHSHHIWEYPRLSERKVKTHGKHYYILEIPKQQTLDTFALFTDCGVGCSLSVLLCNDAELPSSNDSSSELPTALECERNTLSTVPVPGSTATSTLPLYESDRFTGIEYRFASRPLSELARFQYVVIEESYPVDRFLIVEFKNEADSVHVIETSTLALLRDGLVLREFPENPTLVSTVKLPNVDNSLLAYNLRVHTVSSQGRRFHPIMKQSSWTLNENKYAVNIASKKSGIDVNFHGNLPYFDTVLLGTNTGIELRFWTDPTCSEQLSLTVAVDIYGSLGKLVARYRTTVLVFTFMVIILTIRAQILDRDVHGSFKPFGVVLSTSTKGVFWQFSLALGIVSAIQSLKDKTIIHTHLGEHMMERQWSSWFDDALLGRSDPIFWFLAPMIFQVAVGIVAFIWCVLNTIVRAVGFVAMAVTKTTSGTLGNSVKVGRILVAVLLALVATVLPYQFAFAATFVALIAISVRALVIAQRMPAEASRAAWDHYHFAMAILVMFFFLLPFNLPSLMVWIRNFAVGWHKSFASDHRVDYIAPFVIFTEGLANGTAVTKTTWRRYTRLTVTLLDVILVYLVVFGARYSWQVYFLTRVWVSWLLVLRFMETDIGNKFEGRIRRTIWPAGKQD